MWVRRKQYDTLEYLGDDNNVLLGDVKRKLQTCSVICHTDYIILKPEVWHKISDKITQLENENKDLAAELEWYKVKYHEMKENKQNDYYKGAKDFIEWLLTNDKYAACTIDTDEECILCEVGLTKDMWTKSADELLKEFQKSV